MANRQTRHGLVLNCIHLTDLGAQHQALTMPWHAMVNIQYYITHIKFSGGAVSSCLQTPAVPARLSPDYSAQPIQQLPCP